jgi:hypothetical protein
MGIMSGVIYFVLETETAASLGMLKPQHVTSTTFQVICMEYFRGGDVQFSHNITHKVCKLNAYRGGYVSLSQ